MTQYALRVKTAEYTQYTQYTQYTRATTINFKDQRQQVCGIFKTLVKNFGEEPAPRGFSGWMDTCGMKSVVMDTTLYWATTTLLQTSAATCYIIIRYLISGKALKHLLAFYHLTRPPN